MRGARTTTESPESVGVAVNGIGDASLRRKILNVVREVGFSPDVFHGPLSTLVSGRTGRRAARLIVIADLCRLVEAYLNAGDNAWRSFVGPAHPMLVALVRGPADERRTAHVGDLMRASESRLWMLSARQGSMDSFTEGLAGVLHRFHPEALVDVRYAQGNRTLWLEFGDGFKATLAWSALGLDEVRPALRPDTVRLGREPETLEVLDAKGRVFDVDTAVIRAVVDRRTAARQYAVSEATSKSLGDRLRLDREERGLTQEQLASRSGLTQEMISNMERGKHHPRLDTLEKYARGLGISMSALLDA